MTGDWDQAFAYLSITRRIQHIHFRFKVLLPKSYISQVFVENGHFNKCLLKTDTCERGGYNLNHESGTQ